MRGSSHRWILYLSPEQWHYNDKIGFHCCLLLIQPRILLRLKIISHVVKLAALHWPHFHTWKQVVSTPCDQNDNVPYVPTCASTFINISWHFIPIFFLLNKSACLCLSKLHCCELVSPTSCAPRTIYVWRVIYGDISSADRSRFISVYGGGSAVLRRTCQAEPSKSAKHDRNNGCTGVLGRTEQPQKLRHCMRLSQTRPGDLLEQVNDSGTRWNH